MGDRSGEFCVFKLIVSICAEQIGAMQTQIITEPVTSLSKLSRILAMVLPLFALGIVNPLIAAAAAVVDEVDDDHVATAGLVARCLSKQL